jgi:hypothetical protein
MIPAFHIGLILFMFIFMLGFLEEEEEERSWVKTIVFPAGKLGGEA